MTAKEARGNVARMMMSMSISEILRRKGSTDRYTIMRGWASLALNYLLT